MSISDRALAGFLFLAALGNLAWWFYGDGEYHFWVGLGCLVAVAIVGLVASYGAQDSWDD